ncbi:MAG: hypothetical protein OEZ34_15500 [Spirochaetia bacterium]|nr:hypothetical protein [Spirochaetia bacterium]
MNRKLYNMVIGSMILISLFFDIKEIIYGIIVIVLFEALTDILIPRFLVKIPFAALNDSLHSTDTDERTPCRFNFHADRMWRITMAFILILSFVLFFDFLWFIPWFLGFAILGAGISDVCPMLEILRYVGFRR